MKHLSLLCLCLVMLACLVGCNTRTDGDAQGVPPYDNADVNDVTGLRIHPDDDIVVRLLKTHLLAKMNNDYDTWSSTVLVDLDGTDIDFAITSFVLKDIRISDRETTAMRRAYSGSVLAQHKGWSDDFINENMLIVTVEYIVEYDHTRVPYSVGHAFEPFILIRENAEAPWLIWNIQDDSDKVLVLTSHPDEQDAIKAVKDNWIAGRDPGYDRLSPSFHLHKWENPENVTTIYDDPTAVVSWATYYFEISEEETEHMCRMWHGNSTLKERVGWAEDDSIYENMVVIAERHATYYDGRKVFYFSGPGTHFYVLVRESPDSPWLYKEQYSHVTAW